METLTPQTFTSDKFTPHVHWIYFYVWGTHACDIQYTLDNILDGLYNIFEQLTAASVVCF